LNEVKVKIRMMLAVLLLSVCAYAQTYTYSTLATPGTGAYGALAIHDNILYGYAGGGTHDGGLMYSLTTGGKLTTLYNFGATSTDGKNAVGAPNFQSSTGDWYGITTAGGKPRHGTIFKLTNKNKESTVYAWSPYWLANFTSEPQMTLDSSGNLYGYDDTSPEGSGGNDGNAFQVTPKGVITQFGGYDVAGSPIINGTTLYGTSTDGGNSPAGYGGSVFSFTTENVFNTIYSFCSLPNCTDGLYPMAKLIQNTAGDLFGTTLNGGEFNSGIVFEVTISGEETVLYSFCALANCADGGYPYGPVVIDSGGNLYGVNNAGVFEVTPQGVETLIYATSSLDQCNGAYYCLEYALVMDTVGNLYGINSEGGVFRLTKN
jgi:uncharacterized repeat protein (TIGR03803 family)